MMQFEVEDPDPAALAAPFEPGEEHLDGSIGHGAHGLAQCREGWVRQRRPRWSV